jgi:hypothetical protein
MGEPSSSPLSPPEYRSSRAKSDGGRTLTKGKPQSVRRAAVCGVDRVCLVMSRRWCLWIGDTGTPPGDGVQFWTEAEQELLAAEEGRFGD